MARRLIPIILMAALAVPAGWSGTAVVAQTRATAPETSPRPPARPNTRGTVSGVLAGPGGLVRSAPPPRPVSAVAAGRAVAEALEAAPPQPAQVPGNMVPVATEGQAPVAPSVDLSVALAPPVTPQALPPAEAGLTIPVTEGPGALRPAPRVAVEQAVIEALAAAVLDPAATPAAPADRRAVARSLVPPERTAAARRRFEASVAQALAAAQARDAARAEIRRGQTPRAEPAAAVAQPQRGAEPSGPGLCGMPGLQGRRLPRVTSSVRGCGIDEPVSLTAVHGVRLSTPATLHCDAARATGRWVRDVMQPAVGRTGGGVTEIRVAAHYACRPRNNQRGARISEHGRGRAIDISGFRLANGEQVVILRDYNRGQYSAMLRRMRTGACGIFQTILGPGSDRFHADHFHFDSAQRGNYCR